MLQKPKDYSATQDSRHDRGHQPSTYHFCIVSPARSVPGLNMLPAERNSRILPEIQRCNVAERKKEREAVSSRRREGRSRENEWHVLSTLVDQVVVEGRHLHAIMRHDHAGWTMLADTKQLASSGNVGSITWISRVSRLRCLQRPVKGIVQCRLSFIH